MELAIHNHPPLQRFTLDGSTQLECRLAELCEEIRIGTLRFVGEKKLEALVLGGGYGRGQGGVLRTPGGDDPYNDLEFYVFVKGGALLNRARFRERFNEWGDALSPKAGLHVEFKIDSLEKLRRSPVSIFSYDLVMGHRVIHGGEGTFRGCEHHRDSTRIEPAEATRLLLNRCSGLLLVKELLLESQLTNEQCDFVGRNLAKAKLSLGDALLAAEGHYHWDCRERQHRLFKLSNESNWVFTEQVLELHRYGVGFKLHPCRILKTSADFKAEHDELTELALRVWLWVENARLKKNFPTLEEYSMSRVKKCAGESFWRNVVLNVRTFGATATLDQNAPRYPRERLFNALPLLLASEGGTAVPGACRHLQRQLHTRAEDWQGLVAAYKQVWSCYG